MNATQAIVASAQNFLAEARSHLPDRPVESDGSAKQAWFALQRAERAGAPTRVLLACWVDLACFIGAELAPVAIEHGARIYDDKTRSAWYRDTADTLRSVFLGYRALQDRGHIGGPNIAVIEPHCLELLDVLEAMARAPLA